MHQTVDMHTAINKINVPDFVRDVRGPHVCVNVSEARSKHYLAHETCDVNRNATCHCPQTLSNLKT